MILLIVLAVVIYRNFHQKKRANLELEKKIVLRTQELIRSNRDLKNFLYKSSHDLRSPIASIKGLINIAREDAGDVNALHSHLERINTVIEKQDAALTTLLKISRLIEGKIEPADIQLEELLNEIIAQQRADKNCTEIDIISDVPPGLEVHTDRVILTSIIQNLLSNAVKYKRRRGAERSFVKITVRPLGNDITIEVQDNGEGIPEHWHDKIFDLFSRGTSTGEGAGLGLYIVQSSVDLLKGKLHFESTFGKGTTFILMFSKRMKPDNQ
jgi:signal transduction histidine kinase